MTTHVKHTLIWFNVALRALVEIGLVAGLGYWGSHTGTTTTGSALLALAAPTIGFGIWAAIDFHQLGRWAEPARLLQELAIAGWTVLALTAAAQPALAATLAATAAIHYLLVYALGNRLLDRTRQTRQSPPVPAGA